jgi:hypothetical protein
MVLYGFAGGLVQSEVSEPSAGGSKVESGRDVDAVREKEKEKWREREEWMNDDEQGGPREGLRRGPSDTSEAVAT